MQHNYYNTIDELPIKVWFHVHKTGDLKKLLIDNVQFTVALFDKLADSWESMFDQWMSQFGLSDEYMASLRQRKLLANYQAELIITGKPHFKTLIMVEQEKMKMDSNDDMTEMPLEKTLAKISKYYGFKLDSRNLTVSQYYSYIENITNG